MASDPVRLADQVAGGARAPMFDAAQTRKLLRGAVQTWADEFAIREVRQLREEIARFHSRLDRIEAKLRVSGATEEVVSQLIEAIGGQVEYRLTERIGETRIKRGKKAR